MKLQIDHLFNHPARTEAVARMIYNEFWLGQPGYDTAYFIGRLREANDANRIPLSLVAIADDKTAGTVNLIENDDEKRTYLRPWLAALVVAPEYRRQGIGTRLVRALLAEARRLGVGTVYFGTDGRGFYASLGAQVHEQVNERFCIMRFEV